ncbi:2368_t:CDS:2 [Diversispora eburnea]|uniref:2368_t:CDS:1 n=1 Tax=Diversispora eburnea TaxID=1213867 RepID=A0A9N8V3D7_9GLOM|nr:2368_t:CDS:2 [Diversispora eburnea]
MNSVVEDNQSDNGSENIDLEDSLSSDNDDDAPFEYMYNRRVPIINTTHVVNSRSDMRYNTRRHSLRHQLSLFDDSSQSFSSDSLTIMSNNSAQYSSSSHTRSVLHSLHNHYSPKSLSPLEIFIKSQLSKQDDEGDYV